MDWLKIITMALNGVTIVCGCLTIYFLRKSSKYSKQARKHWEDVERDWKRAADINAGRYLKH